MPTTVIEDKGLPNHSKITQVVGIPFDVST